MTLKNRLHLGFASTPGGGKIVYSTRQQGSGDNKGDGVGTPLSSQQSVLTDAERELRSITNFVMAGVGVGKVRVEEEYKKFEQTGESGYSEGHAAGFLRAMQLVADFIDKKDGG